MADRRNLARAHAFREALASYAAMRTGLSIESRSPYGRTSLSGALSAAETPDHDPGDLQGLPRLTAVVTARYEQTPGPDLDRAVDMAHGRDSIPVAVLWRRGRSVGDQLAVVRFRDLLDLAMRPAS